jgi:S-adenosylmethionine synthetase
MTDGEIARKVLSIFDMRPKALVERLGLKNPIFSPTAAYGHMGRQPYTKEVEVSYVTVKENSGERTEIRKKENKKVEFFTWEKLDYVEKVKKEFNL